MKRIVLLLLCLILAVLSLSSCSAETRKTEESAVDAAQTQPQENNEETSEQEEKEPEKQEISSDFKEAYAQKNEAYAQMKSFTANVKAVADFKYDETESTVLADSVAEVSIEDLITHVIASVKCEPYIEPQNTELYAQTGEQPTVYMNVDGTWQKSSMSESDSAQIMLFAGKADTENFDIMKYMLNTSVSEEIYNETECYKISYDINAELYNIIVDLGYKDVFDDMLKAYDVPALVKPVLVSKLNNLGTISVSEYIDVSTMYPVTTVVDATNFSQSVLKEVAAYAPMLIDDEVDFEKLSIESVVVTVEYSNIDETEISVPEEVLEAAESESDSTSVGIIGGADGPTEILVS
ncbi:MAG: sodium ion-translocating decarboxylase subunit beta [Ruminococcaceae bacterium]|nr:sodium ion-translocating decarboxylase subunit beta [Oscillospiraceae bacterium]